MDIPKGAPQPFDGFHVLESGFQRVGCGAHGLHGRVSGALGGDAGLLTGRPRVFAGRPCRLSCSPHSLPFVPCGVERFTMLLANLALVFSQSPEIFGRLPGGLG